MDHTVLFERVGSDYISILDGDDLWVGEDRLQTQVDFLETHPEYTICVGQTQSLVDGKPGGFWVNPDLYGKTLSFKDEFSFPFYFHTSSYLFRNIVYRYGMPSEFFSPDTVDYIFSEDYRRILHIERGGLLYVMPKLVSYYRIHKSWWTGISEVEKSIKRVIGTRIVHKLLEPRHPELKAKFDEIFQNLYRDMWQKLLNEGHIYPEYKLSDSEHESLLRLLEELRKDQRTKETANA